MAKFAPPTEEELDKLAPATPTKFAPPTAEQLQTLAQPEKSVSKFAPPTSQELESFGIKKPEVEKGGAFIGEDIKMSELEDIASRNKVDVSLLKRLAPYYGASVEGEEGIAQTIGRGVGFASEALGGIPTFIAKKISPEIGEKEERALDELNELAQKKKSYLQAGAEMASALAIPGAAAVKGGKLAATTAAGIEGAAYGLGESKKGEELESAALGAGVGVVVGPAIGYTVKTGGRVINALKDVYKANKAVKEAAKDVLGEASVKAGDVTDAIVEAEATRMEQYLDEGKKIFKATKTGDFADVTEEQAKLLLGKAGTKWREKLTDKASKLSEEDFALLYQRTKNLEDLTKEGFEGALKETNKSAQQIRRIANVVLDGVSVVRDVDFRKQTDFTTSMHRMGQGINLSSYKFKQVSDTYIEPLGRKLYKLGEKKQSMLLDELEASKTGPVSEEFSEVASEWRRTMQYFLKFGEEHGVPVQEVAGKKGYVPKMPVDIATSIIRMENKIDEVGKTLEINPLNITQEAFEKLTNPEIFKDNLVLKSQARTFSPLIRTIQYYTGKTPKTADEFKSVFRELLIPGSDLRAKADNEIGALFQRTNALPSYLRERNLVKLLSNYGASIVKYAYMKGPMAEFQYKIDRLRVLTKQSVSGEASEDVAKLQKMLDNYKGDMVGIPRWAKNKEIEIKYKFLKAASKLPEESPGKPFLEFMAESPEVFKGLQSNMYANFLQNPKVAINNIIGATYTYIPEMGNIYGPSLLIPSMAKAVAKLSQPSYWRFLYEKGVLQVEPGRWFAEAARGGRPKGLISRGLKGVSDGVMIGFSAGEALVRATVYETSQLVLASLKKSNFGQNVKSPWQKMANMYVDKMPPRVAKNLREAHLKEQAARKAGNIELADKIAQSINDDFTNYVVDRIAFSYNKISKSEAATYVGSWLSAFTKYPSVVAGRAMESLREPPTLAGKGARVASYFIMPYVSASILNHVLFSNNPQLEEALFGQQRGDDFFGRGIATLTPAATAGSLFTEGLRAPVPFQTVKQSAQALGKLSEGNPEGAEKLFKTSIETFTPGGLGGIPLTIETITGADVPFLGKER